MEVRGNLGKLPASGGEGSLPVELKLITRFVRLRPWLWFFGLIVSLAVGYYGFLSGSWSFWSGVGVAGLIFLAHLLTLRLAGESLKGYLRKGEFMEAALERAVSSYLVLSRDGTILRHSKTLPLRPYVSREVVDKLGQLRLRGMEARRVLSPELYQLFVHYVASLDEGGETRERYYDFALATPQGQRYFRVRFFLTHDAAVRGIAIGMLINETTAENAQVAELRHRLEEVARREQRYRSVVEQATEAIILISRERLEIVEVNEQAEDLTTLARFQLVGMSPLSLFDDHDRRRLHYWLKNLHQYQRPIHLDMELVRPDGTTVEVAVSLGLLRHVEDDLVIVMLRDITQRKRLEQETLESNKLITAINEISQLINESLELEDIFRVTAQQVRRMVHAEVMVLATQVDRRTLRISQVSDLLGLSNWQEGEILGRDYEHLWQFLKSENPYLISYRDESGSWFEERFDRFTSPESRELMIIALRSRKEELGVLILESTKPSSFGKQEVEFMIQVATLFTNALRNAQLFDQERKNNLLFDLINQFSERSLQSLQVDELVQAAARDIQRLFNFSNVTILFADRERKVLWVHTREGLYKDTPGARTEIPFGAGLVGRAYEQGKTIISHDVRLDPRFVEDVPGGVRHVSEVAIPLGTKEEVIGVLDLQSTRPQFISKMELNALEVLANQLAISIQKARTYEELNRTYRQLEYQKRTIESDLRLSAQIQHQMLPLNFRHPKVDVVVHYEPHRDIGGDYAQILEQDNFLYLIIGDVSGHGISSAMIIGAVHHEIVNLVRELAPPAEIVVKLNRFIVTNFADMGLFLTMFVGRLNLETLELEAVNHGHPSVYLLSEGNRLVAFESTDHPVGMMSTYPDEVVVQREQLAPGDRLLLMTDGMFVYHHGREVISEGHLAQIFRDLGSQHLKIVARELLRETDRLRSERSISLNDDRLMVAIELRKDYSFCFFLRSLSDVDQAGLEVEQLGRWAGYPTDEINTLRLVIHELATNAVLHGNRLDDRKVATVTGYLRPDHWEVTVEDEGHGFDYQRYLELREIEDPMEATRYGRGIRIVRNLTDYLRFADSGRRVVAGKKLPQVANFHHLKQVRSLFSRVN